MHHRQADLTTLIEAAKLPHVAHREREKSGFVATRVVFALVRRFAGERQMGSAGQVARLFRVAAVLPMLCPATAAAPLDRAAQDQIESGTEFCKGAYGADAYNPQPAGYRDCLAEVERRRTQLLEDQHASPPR